MAPVEGDRAQDLVRIAGRDLSAASAVHVEIHESGHHVAACEVVYRA
jgi:hypothetical protein